jgi:hypothetical protein
MARLVDFLGLYGVEIDRSNYKMHLATGKNSPPLDAYFAGKFKEWQEDQTQRNFQCEHVIALISLGGHRWLFAGAYKILGCEANGDRYRYATELLPGQNDIVGRVIVHYQRRFRASYLRGRSDGGDFLIGELREKALVVEEFPGYHALTIPHSTLKLIIEQGVASWRGALSSIKGVYLIADRSNGLKYVGSALGNEGIWQRWESYIASGHGGNTDLRAALRDKGDEHVSNFQFSLLEIADTYASDDYVLERESYWKRALLTRTFGYNSN